MLKKRKIIKEKLNEMNKGEIAIYKPKSGEVELEVKLDNETVWLSQKQIAVLFGTERSVITKHLRNIFQSEELDQNSVCAKIAHTAPDGKIYKTQFYNLDMIISVGYRVNSKRATQFRIWSTKILKEHLIKGYTINKDRILELGNKFKELQSTISFLQKKSEAELLKSQGKNLLDLLADYSRTLTILEDYDKNKLKEIKGGKTSFKLEYEHCLEIITNLKNELVKKKEASEIFGNERGRAFEGMIKSLYQTFGGHELYKDLEAKSAHLLYLGIKDHAFSDGNKRISSFLFVYFLDRNNYLYRENGEKKINDNALAALALLIAESNPKEKSQMVALITQLLR